MEDLKRQLREMVGVPISESAMSGIDWMVLNNLAPTERRTEMSRLASSLRESVMGNESVDKILLG